MNITKNIAQKITDLVLKEAKTNLDNKKEELNKFASDEYHKYIPEHIVKFVNENPEYFPEAKLSHYVCSGLYLYISTRLNLHWKFMEDKPELEQLIYNKSQEYLTLKDEYFKLNETLTDKIVRCRTFPNLEKKFKEVYDIAVKGNLITITNNSNTTLGFTNDDLLKKLDEFIEKTK